MKTRIVKIGDKEIGNGNFSVIAGPCSVESYDQLLETAGHVKDNGAMMLRGGIYKLRTNPDSFQGIGREAFDIIKQVKEKTQLSFISEITDPRQISDFHPIVDAYQVGSRNMHNYALLKELGSIDKPVLLKRGFSGLIDEWLKAADYIRNAGNEDVILW